MNKDKVILILVGIPCSGKSTWTENFRPFWKSYHKLIISRDYFREHYFNNYKITNRNYPGSYTLIRINYMTFINPKHPITDG